MYPDHAPPHFHVRGPGWSVVVNIKGFKVARGRPPKKAKKELARAIRWAKDNKALLVAEWERLSERDD